MDFGFKPSQVFLFRVKLQLIGVYELDEAFKYEHIREELPDGVWGRGVDEFSENGFTLWVTVASGNGGNISPCSPYVYAYA